MFLFKYYWKKVTIWDFRKHLLALQVLKSVVTPFQGLTKGHVWYMYVILWRIEILQWTFVQTLLGKHTPFMFLVNHLQGKKAVQPRRKYKIFRFLLETKEHSFGFQGISLFVSSFLDSLGNARRHFARCQIEYFPFKFRHDRPNARDKTMHRNHSFTVKFETFPVLWTRDEGQRPFSFKKSWQWPWNGPASLEAL